MPDHSHRGPNSMVIQHNHSHGDIDHNHGKQKGFDADRWQWESESATAHRLEHQWDDLDDDEPETPSQTLRRLGKIW